MRSFYAKTLTVLLAASIWLPQPGLCARFADTSASWTEKYINKLSDKNIIPPAPDGKFNPDKPVTRAQLADWLVKVLGLENQPVPSSSSFADVKTDDWFFRPVEIIRQNNYISGYADGFRPNQFIQRAEVMTILSRTLNSQEPDLKQISTELSKYSDGDKVPGWARTGVAEASLAGIVVNDNTPKSLDPTAIATRGQTAAFLSHLDDYLTQKLIDTSTQLNPPIGASQAAQAATPNIPTTGAAPLPGRNDAFNTASATAGGGAPPPSGAMEGSVIRDTFSPPGSPGAPSYPPQYPQYPQHPEYGPVGAATKPSNYLQGAVTTVAEGTNFHATLMNTLDSASSQQGEQVQATIGQPIYSNGVEAVPAGSKLLGTVSSVQSAKRFHAGANGKIDIRFDSLETPDGRRFPLSASVDGAQIHLSGGTTAGRVGKGMAVTGIGAGTGAAAGTAMGAIIGATNPNATMGKSIMIGAVFGTALGTGAGAVTAVVRKGSEVRFPAGMSLPVKLDTALQISPPPPQPYYGGSYNSR